MTKNYDLYFDPTRGEGKWVIEENGRVCFMHSIHETAQAKLKALMGAAAEDAHDAKVAEQSIADIEAGRVKLVSGDELAVELARMGAGPTPADIVAMAPADMKERIEAAMADVSFNENPKPSKAVQKLAAMAAEELAVEMVGGSGVAWEPDEIPRRPENAAYWHRSDGWYFDTGTQAMGPFPLFIDAVIARWKTLSDRVSRTAVIAHIRDRIRWQRENNADPAFQKDAERRGWVIAMLENLEREVGRMKT